MWYENINQQCAFGDVDFSQPKLDHVFQVPIIETNHLGDLADCTSALALG